METVSFILIGGTEYDLVHRETLRKIHAAPYVQERTGLWHTGDGSVFVFFMHPPEGIFEKGRTAPVGRRLL